MADYSYVFNAHPSHIDTIYQKYMADPSSVEDGWRSFFQGYEFSQNTNGHSSSGATGPSEDINKEFGVQSIIHGFRSRGHLLSRTNPIRSRRDRRPHLDLSDYGLSDGPQASLQEILDRLKTIYCGHIGFEYAHIENKDKRTWLRDKIENREFNKSYGLSLEKKKRILEKLNGAVGFESFLNKKYVGQKRFSLEGGESAIPAIDAIIMTGASLGVKEVVIGMAHRGRLNVLANIMGKTYDHIFNEFEGTAVPDLSLGDGDVKYHLGYSSIVSDRAGNEVHLKLVPNPSHLSLIHI